MQKTSVRLAEGDDKKLIVVCGDCGNETSAEALPKPTTPTVIRLSDVGRNKDGRLDFAGLSGKGDVLIAPEVFHAERAQTALDEAIAAGKILPAQRRHYEALALSDATGFSELVATMRPQVDLTERGIAGGGGAGAGDINQVDERIERLAAEKRAVDQGLGYREAVRLVLSEHPELEKQRKALMRD